MYTLFYSILVFLFCSVLFIQLLTPQSLILSLYLFGSSCKRFHGKYKTNGWKISIYERKSSQIADDLHAVHTTHTHLLHRVSERESKCRLYVHKYVLACVYVCLDGKDQPGEPIWWWSTWILFCLLWFFLHLFSIHIIIGSQKKSRTFMHTDFHIRAFKNETVRNVYHLETFLESVLRATTKKMQRKCNTNQNTFNMYDGYKLAQLFTNSDIVKFVHAYGHEWREKTLLKTHCTHHLRRKTETSSSTQYITWTNSLALLRHLDISFKYRNECGCELVYTLVSLSSLSWYTRFFKLGPWYFPLHLSNRFTEAKILMDMWYRIKSKLGIAHKHSNTRTSWISFISFNKYYLSRFKRFDFNTLLKVINKRETKIVCVWIMYYSHIRFG